MMSGVCIKSAKSAKSASGALDAHFVRSTCILCADFKYVNEPFVQTMCTLYLPKSLVIAQVTLIVDHTRVLVKLWCLLECIHCTYTLGP